MDFKRYLKYFNYGYFLSKFEPKILKNLLTVFEKEPEISEPLEAGKSQYKREQVIDKLKSYSKEPQKGREIDKDLNFER